MRRNRCRKGRNNCGRDLTSPFYFCPGGFMPGRRCQISSHYIIPHSFCQVKKFFKFFFCQFFSPSSSLYARRPAVKFYALSNFMYCQILIAATNQLHQLGLSNFESATKPAVKFYNSYKSLYIYISPFIITQILKLIKL